VQGDGDTLPANAQQQGKEFVGYRDSVGLHAVVPHQQPASEPFIEPASPVGERCPAP